MVPTTGKRLGERGGLLGKTLPVNDHMNGMVMVSCSVDCTKQEHNWKFVATVLVTQAVPVHVRVLCRLEQHLK